MSIYCFVNLSANLQDNKMANQQNNSSTTQCVGMFFYQLTGKSSCQHVSVSAHKHVNKTTPGNSCINQVGVTQGIAWRKTLRVDQAEEMRGCGKPHSLSLLSVFSYKGLAAPQLRLRDCNVSRFSRQKYFSRLEDLSQ